MASDRRDAPAASDRCWNCGGDAGDNWFDRSICPEPCNSMHTRCSACGVALDACPFDGSKLAPDGSAEPVAASGRGSDAEKSRAVKERLYSRHPGSGGQMPGPWTVLEEWRAIDVLAFSAWSSAQDYARVGYEVKVSRSDMRSELLRPHKRAANVAWCNEFYFAVPAGLLTEDELMFEEPEWTDADWMGERCPGVAGRQCEGGWPKRRKTYYLRVPKPSTSVWERDEKIVCPTCGGKGRVSEPRVLSESPTLWVPRDVGLVIVDGRGAKVFKRSPRRKEVPVLSPAELGRMVRWISMRPDPRHATGRELVQARRQADHERQEARRAVA